MSTPRRPTDNAPALRIVTGFSHLPCAGLDPSMPELPAACVGASRPLEYRSMSSLVSTRGERMPTLRVQSLLVGDDERPPLILVHGASNSARVWTFWQDELTRRGWSSHALDLRGHGTSAPVDLGTTRMADYADDLVTLARTLRRPPVLLGWSMGGLVAMMAAPACGARGWVGLPPRTPARRRDTSVPLPPCIFCAEENCIADRHPDP